DDAGRLRNFCPASGFNRVGFRPIRGRIMKRILFVATAWLVVSLAWAEDPKTTMTKLGKLVLQDDFTASTDAGWKKAKGKWEIESGFLRAAELKSDMHGAAMRLTPATPLERAVFQYSLKFDGAKQTSLSLN